MWGGDRSQGASDLAWRHPLSCIPRDYRLPSSSQGWPGRPVEELCGFHSIIVGLSGHVPHSCIGSLTLPCGRRASRCHMSIAGWVLPCIWTFRLCPVFWVTSEAAESDNLVHTLLHTRGSTSWGRVSGSKAQTWMDAPGECRQVSLYQQFRDARICQPGGFPAGQDGKESACNAGDSGSRSLGPEDPLEKDMATHSSILAWKIPWTVEPGGLQSTGSHRVRCD